MEEEWIYQSGCRGGEVYYDCGAMLPETGSGNLAFIALFSNYCIVEQLLSCLAIIVLFSNYCFV